MQHGVDHLPVGDLADLDEADQDGKLEVVRHRHFDDLLRSLDLAEGRPREVRHSDDPVHPGRNHLCSGVGHFFLGMCPFYERGVVTQCNLSFRNHSLRGEDTPFAHS